MWVCVCVGGCGWVFVGVGVGDGLQLLHGSPWFWLLYSIMHAVYRTAMNIHSSCAAYQ